MHHIRPNCKCILLRTALLHQLVKQEPLFWQGTPEGVEDSGWLTRVAAFPIGIQPERFAEALERLDVKGHIAGLLTRYAGRKVWCCASQSRK